MRITRRFGPLLLLALLSVFAAGALGGCRSEPKPSEQTASEAASSDDGTVATSPAELTGTSWVLESLGGGDDQVAAQDDVQTTLGFLADRYGGTGGCNFYVGVYNADEARLKLETPARTGATCEESPEALTQESVFMSALATVASYGMDGEKLVMFSSSDQLMLTMASMESAPLQDTLWHLQFVSVETKWTETLADTEITMRIADGKLSGSTGCNEYSANVSEEAGALTISDLSFTEMGCVEPDGVMEQEALYLSNLEQAALLRQYPVSLQLLDIDGVPLLLYGAENGVNE